MAHEGCRRIGLTVKLHLENKEAAMKPILDVLRARNAEVFVDAHTVGDCASLKGLPPIVAAQDLDCMIAVGGDGTILRTIRELQPVNVPIIAVNAGSVGFLSEMRLADVPDRLANLLSGTGSVEHRTCIEVDVHREDECVFHCIGLNDAVISQGSLSRLLDLQATVNGNQLATYHADGLIVSTPTGSTAYSLAAGGPVVHPVVSALILTPINPHSFTQKPIVLPGDSLVELTIVRGEFPAFSNTTVGLTVDGQVYQELHARDRIRIRTGMTAQFLRSDPDAFYRALRTKLKWGEGL